MTSVEFGVMLVDDGRRYVPGGIATAKVDSY